MNSTSQTSRMATNPLGGIFNHALQPMSFMVPREAVLLMGATFWPEAVRARQAADEISPATLEDLEAEAARSGGLAFAYLASKAPHILSGSRNASPLAHLGCWAFDIDGFVFVTAVPYSGKTYRDAREVFFAALSHSMEVATACPGRPTVRVATTPRVASATHALKASSPAGRSLDAILSSIHYTAIPAWALDGTLALTISERIVLADVVDIMGSGSVLSWESDLTRLRARTGLKASSASFAIASLTRRGVLKKANGCRGRYALSWMALAALVCSSPAASAIVGRCLTPVDARHRLADKSCSLALPAWAVELCGATEAALLLAKGWAVAHGRGDGYVWASGATLSSWLPGSERSLRRARARLSSSGLAEERSQYSSTRVYGNIELKNRTCEFKVDAARVARALLVRGYDFGVDMAGAVSSFFFGDTSLAAECAAYESARGDALRLRSLRRGLATIASAGCSWAMSARRMLDITSSARYRSPWRGRSLKALPATSQPL